MDIPLAISSVLGSCCGCMIFVEYLAKEDPGSMNLMTFSTFLFISLEGFIMYNKFGTVKNIIPLRSYIELVIIFFAVSVINNQALNFHIPVPLHIIFRSGSLISNMLMGMWLLKKRYSLGKYVSVIFVTAGIIVCTLATSTLDKVSGKSSHSQEKDAGYFSWIIGISMLWFALFFSSLLGIRQEQLFTRYGKHSREALFYIHALSLPGFLLFSADIYKHVQIFNASKTLLLPLVDVSVPRLWLFLLLNDISQYVCIRSVYQLTAECTSLTVTLVLTLRKFLSLLISIAYFGNAFTSLHWLGTFLVFVGTVVFSDLHIQVADILSRRKSKLE